MLKRSIHILAFLLAGLPAIAFAQDEVAFTPAQKGYFAYDDCMKGAAVRASRTDAREEDVFGLAKAQCAATREKVVIGLASDREFLEALDQFDTDEETNFPDWIKVLRERRRLGEPEYEPVGPAPK